MKTKIYVASIGLLLTLAAHAYLAFHYYPLRFGFVVNQSLCNLNAKFDCDAVSASKYAALFGIPIANFGFAFNLILLAIVWLDWFGLRSQSEESRRDSLWLALGSVLASVVMGSISLLFMKQLCLFCLSAYGLSIVIFVALYLSQEKSPFSHFASDLQAWFVERRSMLGWLAAVPVIATVIHIGMIQNFGADQLDGVVRSSVAEWQAETQVPWSAAPSLTKGADVQSAKMVITEFADFRCGHCKAAAPSISAFVKAHSDNVRMMFYTFPLDGACNPVIERSDGVSCQLAKAVYCAGKVDKGWELHDLIFEEQHNFASLSNATLVDNELKGKTQKIGLDWSQIEVCLQDPATHAAIVEMAKQGVTAKVQGTPTIFVNGKKLDRGQLLPVLEAVLKNTLN